MSIDLVIKDPPPGSVRLSPEEARELGNGGKSLARGWSVMQCNEFVVWEAGMGVVKREPTGHAEFWLVPPQSGGTDAHHRRG